MAIVVFGSSRVGTVSTYEFPNKCDHPADYCHDSNASIVIKKKL